MSSVHSTSHTISPAPFAITSIASSSTFSTPSLAPTVSSTSFIQPVNPSDSSSNPQPSSSTNNGLADSGALYLYTFLATLVLLLSISCAIVIRSLVLRRRRNRIIAEAITNGTWFSRAPNSFHDFGTKPPLYEAFIRDVKSSTIGKGGPEELDWDVIMPFSVTCITPHTEHAVPDRTTLTPTAAPSHIGSRLIRFFPRSNRTNPILPLPVSTTPTSALMLMPSPPPTSSSPTPPLSAKSSSTPSTLRLAVLIAMPTPPQVQHVHVHRSSDDDENEQIPHVEFGVAEVEVGQGVDSGE